MSSTHKHKTTPQIKFKTGWGALGFKSYQEYLSSDLWIEKKNHLIKKRKYCEKCGTDKHLMAHHLTYDNVGNESENELMVICIPCHEKLPKGSEHYE